jgi:ADP-ribosylglycohydrolase
MRVSPLGVWSARFDIDTAINAARSDACLTHPHPNCQWANVAYVIAIRHLLLNPGDHQGAFAAAKSAVPAKEGEYIHDELKKIHEGRSPPESTSNAGFVLIAFAHAFHHLYHATPYRAALSAVLSGGGDTDTNACITGGLLGALWGSGALPEPMRTGVLQCDVSQGQQRPGWLQSKHVEGWIKGLLGSE